MCIVLFCIVLCSVYFVCILCVFCVLCCIVYLYVFVCIVCCVYCVYCENLFVVCLFVYCMYCVYCTYCCTMCIVYCILHVCIIVRCVLCIVCIAYCVYCVYCVCIVNAIPLFICLFVCLLCECHYDVVRKHLQEEVTVVGYPIGGDNLSVTRGVVSRVEPQQYVHGFAVIVLCVCLLLYWFVFFLIASHFCFTRSVTFIGNSDRCRFLQPFFFILKQ